MWIFQSIWRLFTRHGPDRIGLDAVKRIAVLFAASSFAAVERGLGTFAKPRVNRVIL
jgi:hypothetical protein